MRGLMTLSPLFFVAAFSGCSSSEKPAQAPEIATLRFQDGFIEIRAGSNGRTYTLFDAEQKLIASGLTAEDLKARYPDRYEALERGIADADEGVFIDESARRPEAGTRLLRAFPLDASGP